MPTDAADDGANLPFDLFVRVLAEFLGDTWLTNGARPDCCAVVIMPDSAAYTPQRHLAPEAFFCDVAVAERKLGELFDAAGAADAALEALRSLARAGRLPVVLYAGEGAAVVARHAAKSPARKGD